MRPVALPCEGHYPRGQDSSEEHAVTQGPVNVETGAGQARERVLGQAPTVEPRQSRFQGREPAKGARGSILPGGESGARTVLWPRRNLGAHAVSGRGQGLR